MKIVFCGECFAGGPVALKALLPDDEIVVAPTHRAAEMGLDADVLVPLMHRLEPALIRGTGARMIQQWGVGLEGVDIPAATARGIPVCNVPADATLNAESTAEHIVLLMLGVAKRIHTCLAAFERGVWGGPVGEALFGNTALIVGLGNIGKALAKKLKGMDMRVHAIRRTPEPDDKAALGLDRLGNPADLLAMSSQADFVISCVPLNDRTRGVFNAELFAAMKPTAFFINASRGPVVNEDDLLEALGRGTIAAAGLDVFVQEPLDPAHPLLRLENVFATPHVAGVTRQNVEGVSTIVAENIRRLKEGRRPLHCVNAGNLFPEG